MQQQRPHNQTMDHSNPSQICGIDGNRSRLARAHTPPAPNHAHEQMPYQRSSLTPEAKNSLSGGSGRGQYAAAPVNSSAPLDISKVYQKRTY